MLYTARLVTRGSTAGCLALMVSIGALLSVYGPAIPALKANFGISDSAAASGLGVQSMAAVLGVLLGPVLLRRTGNKITLGLASCMVAGGSALIAGAPAWAATLAGAAIAGAGLGACDLIITQILMVGSGRRGPAMVNFAHAAFGIGTVLAPAAIAIVGAANYRYLFAAIAITSVLALVTIKQVTPFPTPMELVPTRPSTDASATNQRWRPAAVLAAFVALYVAHFGVQSGIGSWEPTLLEQNGHNASSAAFATAAFWLAMVVGRTAAAALVGRLSSAVLVIMSCIGTTVAAGLALHPPLIVAAYILTGLCIGPIFPNGLTWLAASGHASGSRFAHVVAGSMVGMAVAPVTIGAVISRHGTMAAPITILGIAVVATLASIAAATLLRTPSGKRVARPSAATSVLGRRR